jgi:hypothetical protein
MCSSAIFTGVALHLADLNHVEGKLISGLKVVEPRFLVYLRRSSPGKGWRLCVDQFLLGKNSVMVRKVAGFNRVHKTEARQIIYDHVTQIFPFRNEVLII